MQDIAVLKRPVTAEDAVERHAIYALRHFTKRAADEEDGLLGLGDILSISVGRDCGFDGPTNGQYELRVHSRDVARNQISKHQEAAIADKPAYVRNLSRTRF